MRKVKAQEWNGMTEEQRIQAMADMGDIPQEMADRAIQTGDRMEIRTHLLAQIKAQMPVWR